MRTRKTLVFLALLAVSGCATSARDGGKTVAALAPAKAPDSGEIAEAIIAEMHGGLVGGKIGANLSQSEKGRALEAEYRALEYTASGQPVTWKSDWSRHYGEVVAAQPYRVGSQDCRQYTHTVYTGGAGVTARGTACRNADGSWTPLT